MRKFLFLMLPACLLLAACAPSADTSAEATLVALSVQLTLEAQATQVPTEPATEPPTETVTEPVATNTQVPSDTPQPTATSFVVPDWPLFRSGDHGPEVYAIQHLLRSHGHNLTVDGIFGPATRQQVIAFQNAKNLSADGIVGPQTWAALIQGRTVDQGDTGQAVRALQRLLRDKFGHNQVTVDGDFGPITESAVKDFQEKYDLAVDGIVGPQTWKALVAIAQP